MSALDVPEISQALHEGFSGRRGSRRGRRKESDSWDTPALLCLDNERQDEEAEDEDDPKCGARDHVGAAAGCGLSSTTARISSTVFPAIPSCSRFRPSARKSRPSIADVSAMSPSITGVATPAAR